MRVRLYYVYFFLKIQFYISAFDTKCLKLVFVSPKSTENRFYYTEQNKHHPMHKKALALLLKFLKTKGVLFCISQPCLSMKQHIKMKKSEKTK